MAYLVTAYLILFPDFQRLECRVILPCSFVLAVMGQGIFIRKLGLWSC